MKRLLQKKGNILLVTVIFCVIVMLGYTLLTLTVAKSISTQESYDKLYARYTDETYARVIVAEIYKSLDSANAYMQWTPLKSSTAIQQELQSALFSAIVNSDKSWRLTDPVPPEFSRVKLQYKAYVDLSITTQEGIDLKTQQKIVIPEISIVIEFKNSTYCAVIENAAVDYTFAHNNVNCRIDTSNAKITNRQYELLR